MQMAKIFGSILGTLTYMALVFGAYYVGCFLVNATFNWRAGVIAVLIVTAIKGIAMAVRTFHTED